MKKRRVVITGLGAISPLGNDVENIFQNLLEGRSGVRTMHDWPAGRENGMLRNAAPVRLTEAEIRSIDRKYRRSMGNLATYAALAAQKAVSDSGLTPEEIQGGRCACVIGSTMGSANSITEAYRIMLLNEDRDLSSMQFFKCVSHTAAFNTANLLGITGSVYSPSAACASGLQAVGMARNLIACGIQDYAVCGGTDEISPEVAASFELISAAGTQNDFPPEKISRPFDSERNGLICGEGAGILILEEFGHAKKRGAKIYGEITGYATCGCGNGISQSNPEAIGQCLDLVLSDAGIPSEKLDYISAHATSTVQGDAAEAEALRKKLKKIPVSSLKGHWGHSLGASGPLELILSLIMMRESVIIPTRNLETPAPECNGLFLPVSPEKHKIDYFLKNCFAFGGINATLICKKI